MAPELAEMIAKATVDRAFREELRANPDRLVGLSLEDKKALMLALDSMDAPVSKDTEVEPRVTKYNMGGQGPWENTPFTG